jgi:hypothetical protein
MVTTQASRVLRRTDRYTLANSRASRVEARTRKAVARDEAGAVLVLALVFLVTVGLIVTGLLQWSSNDLKNTTNFKAGRSVVYAAGGATEAAIWSARYSLTSGTNVPCPGTGSSIGIGGQAIEVLCTTAASNTNPPSAATRVVTLSACPANTPVSTCTTSPNVQAVVTFDDWSNGNPNANNCLLGKPQTTCGTGMTLDSWVVG